MTNNVSEQILETHQNYRTLFKLGSHMYIASENNKLIHLINYCTKYITATAELYNIVIHC